MKTPQQIIETIKADPEAIWLLLEEIADSFEDEGCDGCGTISDNTIAKVHKVLGREENEQ